MFDRNSKVLRGRALADPTYSLVALVADMEAQMTMLEAMRATEPTAKARKELKLRIKEAEATIAWARTHHDWGWQANRDGAKRGCS